MKRLQKGTGGKLMNQIPQAGEIYQHFKGKLYRIVALQPTRKPVSSL